jgi:hypothetical protein
MVLNATEPPATGPMASAAMAADGGVREGSTTGLMPGRRARRMSPRRLVGLLVAAAVVTGCAAAGEPAAVTPGPSSADAPRPTVVVHRTETCSCCGGYEEVLAAAGFRVEQQMHADLAVVRAELSVPDDQQSCHTLEVGGYAAEGHVPIEALDELLTDRPEVDGIALAGMPLGSPGMPGEQEEPFVVRLLRNGEVVGELGRY